MKYSSVGASPSMYIQISISNMFEMVHGAGKW